MSESDAEKLVAALCTYLKENKEPSEDAFCSEGETRSADLARNWTHRLLDASTANGLGGCRLCCG